MSANGSERVSHVLMGKKYSAGSNINALEQVLNTDVSVFSILRTARN